VPWDLRLLDDEGKRLGGKAAYVGLDAFAVPTHAPDGKVDSNMLYVGVLSPPGKEQTVYVSGFDLEGVVGDLRRYAVSCGLGQAEAVVALTDGGNGLESTLRRCFSDGLAFVLDFWHPAEHVFAFAAAWHGADGEAARQLGQAGRAALREGGAVSRGATVLGRRSCRSGRVFEARRPGDRPSVGLRSASGRPQPDLPEATEDGRPTRRKAPPRAYTFSGKSNLSSSDNTLPPQR